MKTKIVDTKDLPLDMLDIGTSQVRTHNVKKGIEDLALSIDRMGLLEPIVVAQKDDGRYEIVTGQRRFLAHKHLGRETIRAQIIEGGVAPDTATAISLTENMVRADISTKEYIDACTELFRKYGSIKAVSEELGLPRHKVSQYVKFDQLNERLQTMVSQGDIKMDVALRAQRAATDPEGNIDEEAAFVYAKEMRNMGGLQIANLERAAQANPGAAPEEIVEVGRRQPRQKRLTITISQDMDDALDRFAADEGAERDNAAVALLESGLSDKGYM